MRILTFDDILSLGIKPEECYQWVDEMIRNKKSSFLPPKTHMNLPNNVFCNVMPSYVDNSLGSWGGVKVVTRYPNRVPSLDSKILLFDKNTGEVLSLMDGNWITAMRTGAVAAHSILLLAKSDFNTIGFIGLGNTARATLLVLLSKIDRPINIKLYRYKNQANTFMKRFDEYSNVTFEVVEDYNEIVSGSDVVVSCVTAFDQDICDDAAFPKGVLVVPVHTRGFTNCDLFFDKVFADDRGHVDHFKNFDMFRSIAEVTDVLNGCAPGRENDDERILAYNIGVSIHDINFASMVYSKARDVGSFIDMKDPKDKFWV